MKKVRQHDGKDCGVACLATVLRHYKSYISVVKIREYMHVDKNGASMFALCQTATNFGLNADGLESSFEEMKYGAINGNLKLPLIAHVVVNEDMQHFVIIEKINDRHIYIYDPAKGNGKYIHSEFEKIFTGYFIILSPGNEFVPVKDTLGPYKKYLDIITKQKKLFLSAIGLSAVLAIFSILCSLAYQTIIDKYILNNRQQTAMMEMPAISNMLIYLEGVCETLPKIFIAMICIYLAQSLIFALRGVIITYIYKNSSQLLISKYCRTMIKLPLPFFHDRETGEVLSRYNDIEEIQSIISGIGLSIIMDFVMAIAGGFVLFSISSQLFLVVVFMTILYALVAFCYRVPIRNISRDIMEADAKLLSKMKETIDGIESIKAACAEEKAEANLHSRTKEYIAKAQKGSLISISQSTLLGLSESVGGIIILWIGCDFILSGTLTLGLFISFETLMYFFIAPIQNLLSMQIVLQQAFVSADRLNDVLENNSEDDFFKGNMQYTSSTQYGLHVENLKFAYGYRKPILKNVSFDANTSEKIAVIGKSGCGKSTLFHILGLLENEYEGYITIDGEDIKNINKKSYREKVICVPQESTLFAASFRENILMGINIDAEQFKKIMVGCQLDDIMNSYATGVEAIIEENGKNLSGGQKQRIAIARALVRNPDILLLDESTSHLDSEMEDRIFKFIAESFPDTLCFFATHKDSIIDMCDRKLYIEDGCIFEIDRRRK